MSKVRLQAGGQVLDLFDNEPINIKASVKKAQSISTLFSPTSKNFTLPASPTNNAFFSYYYHVGIDDGFNAYAKTPATVQVSGDEVIVGYLELLNTVMKDNKPVQYEVLVSSAVPTLIKDIEGLKLEDLTFTDILDPQPQQWSTIEGSWSTPTADAVLRYGLVNYRDIYTATLNGFITDKVANLRETDFFPYIRLKEIVQSILEDAGYQLDTSGFFSDDPYQPDTYLMCRPPSGQDAATKSQFKATSIDGLTLKKLTLDPVTGDVTEDGYKKLNFNTEDFDNGGVWDPVNSVFTALASGPFVFKLGLNGMSNNALVNIVAIKTSDAAATDPELDTGVDVASQGINTRIVSLGTNNLNVTFDLEHSEEYSFYVRLSEQDTNTGTVSSAVRSVQFVSSPSIVAGLALPPSEMMPKDVLQKDFLTTLIKQYNLVITPDRYNPKLLKFNTYDVWKTLGQPQQIDEFVDISKPFTVKPTTSLQSKTIDFKMTDGKAAIDEANKAELRDTVGSYKIENGNEFANASTTIQSKFVLSITESLDGSDLETPRLANDNGELADTGLRIGLWGGPTTAEFTVRLWDNTVLPKADRAIASLPPFKDLSNTDGFIAAYQADVFPVSAPEPLKTLYSEYWRNYLYSIYDDDARIVELELVANSNFWSSFNLNNVLTYQSQDYIVQEYSYDTLSKRVKMKLLKEGYESPIFPDVRPIATDPQTGAIVFEDSSGNEVTDVGKQASSFYGFDYDAVVGQSTSTRSTGATSITAKITSATPEYDPSIDPTGRQPLVPNYNPMTGRYSFLPIESVAGGPYLPLSGGTVTGDVTFELAEINFLTDPLSTNPMWSVYNGQIQQPSDLIWSVNYDGTTENIDFTTQNSSTGWVTINGERVATEDYVIGEGFEKQVNKGAPNGYVPLDASSLIPSAYMPPLVIVDTFVVASEAAQIALSAQQGDIAIRTDESKSYVLGNNDPSVFANWQELLSPTAGGVSSVNGLTGNIQLDLGFTSSTGVLTLTGSPSVNLGFTSSDISNWNTAFGWGNHSTQGYATQTWVNQQNFATQSFVTSQGYVDENLSSLAFDVSTGVLTASLSGGTQTTVDLDGRYLQSVALNDLTDVDAASNKNDGAVLQYSSVLNKFVLTNELDLIIEGSDLVADNSPTAGQVYQYNGTTFQWATVTSGGVTSLNDIGDVSVASPNTNDVLTWNGSTWVASAAGGGAADGVVTGATFSSGTLSLQRSLGLSDVTVNLDGRYLQSYTETDPTGIASMAFSGTSAKTLTITRNNGTTVSASFTDLQGGGGGGQVDGVVNGGVYNNGTGTLTLTRTEGLPDVSINMGGGFMGSFVLSGDTNVSGGVAVTDNENITLRGKTGQGIETESGAFNNTVTFSIKDLGVTTAKINDLAVTNDKIATDAITTIKVNDLAITDAKIADDTITEPKLDIHNAPTIGKVLGYTANGLEWVLVKGGGSADGVVSGATFNTANGNLTLSRTEGLPDIVTDLDGRYLTSSSFTFTGDVSNGSANNVISNGETFQIKGVGGITTGHGLNANELLVTIPPSSINEDRLNIANSPQDGEVLSYDSGGMVWTPQPVGVRGAECSANTPSIVFTPSATLWSKISGLGSVTSFGTSFVSQASNTFTVSEAGVYEVSVSVFWEVTASGSATYTQTGISVNNATPAQSKRRGFFATTTPSSEWVDVKGTFNLSANDTITIVHLGDANSGNAKVREAHINFNKLQ